MTKYEDCTAHEGSVDRLSYVFKPRIVNYCSIVMFIDWTRIIQRDSLVILTVTTSLFCSCRLHDCHSIRMSTYDRIV